jgi:AraC family transcriptional activator of pobA
MKNEIPVYDICSISKIEHDDIIISRFGPYSENNKNLHTAHKHTFYHLVLFTEGSGSHAIDFETFEVKPNQIYFMIPGQVHSWGFTSKADGYIINFSSSFFQSFLLRSNYLENFSFFSDDVRDAVINIPETLIGKIIYLFEEILKEGQNMDKSSFGSDAIRVLLLQLFINITRVSENKPFLSGNSYSQVLLKNFKQLIEKNYKTLKLPKEYAELLYITANHLNAVCKDILGVSAGELIRNRVALEAKRLLISFDLSISEIAYQLNFKDNSYFTKFFKKQTGLTPEEFRKKQ